MKKSEIFAGLIIGVALLFLIIPITQGFGNLIDPDSDTTDHSLLSNLAWSVSGHTIDANIDMNSNQLTDMHTLILSGTGYLGDWDGILNVATDLNPYVSLTYDLGSGVERWRELYVQNISAEYINTFTLDVRDNITADYFFGDGSQLTGISSSPAGSDTHIQYNDGGAFGGDEKYTYTNENENYYAKFDGVKDYIQCAYADQTGLDFGTGDDFSIAFWHLSVTQKDVLWHKGNSATNAGYSFEYSGDKMRFRVANGATSYYTTSTTDTIDTAWHFTVVTKNDAGINIYTDGGNKQTNAQDLSAFDTSAGNPFYIGQGAYGANEWEGSIDDVTWWNMALSDADVSTLFGLGINGGSVQTANIVTKLDFQKGDLTDSYGSNDFSYGANAYITTDDTLSKINAVGEYKSFGRAEFEGDAYFNIRPDGKVGFGVDPDDIALRDYFVFQKTGIDASDTSYRPNVASIYGEFTTGGGNGVFTGMNVSTIDKSSEYMGQQFAVRGYAYIDYNNKLFATMAGGKFASSIKSGRAATLYAKMTGIIGSVSVDNAGKLTLRPATEMAGGSFGITFSGTGDADQMASTSVITELTTASRISAATLDILGGLTITDPTITTGTVGERRAVDIMPQTVATTNWGLYVRGNNNFLSADTYKNYMGDALDSYIEFDGEDLIISSNNITANDEIHFQNFSAYLFDNKVIFTQTDGNEYIDSLADGYMDYRATTAHRFGDGTNQSIFEADGTLEFNGTATVWRDINMGAAQLSRPTSSQPDLVNFVDEAGADTGIQTYAFAVGEKVHGSFEMQHDYKQGSDFTFHIHWQGITAPTGGETVDNVQWRLTYTFGTDDSTLDAVTTIDSADTIFNTQYEFLRTDVVVISGTNREIGQQMLFTLERVDATGDDYAGDALIATVGIHYEIDTCGSREIITK